MKPDRATQILRQVLATMEAEHVTDPVALESIEALRFVLGRMAKVEVLSLNAFQLISEPSLNHAACAILTQKVALLAAKEQEVPRG